MKAAAAQLHSHRTADAMADVLMTTNILCESTIQSHSNRTDNKIMNDRYVFQSVVGEGTFGQTIKALDTRTNVKVAVKYIKDIINASMEEIHNEIQILRVLNCSTNRGRETVVAMMDWFEKDGHPCYVFEYLSCTLDGLLKNKKLNGSELRYIGHALTMSAAFLSSMGIVHGDLKPENVMFNELGELKVVDFGMSFYENNPNCDLCQTRTYRAPEVCLYLKFGCAVDVWSIGCIMAECYSRKPLLKSRNELQHFQMMAEIFGMLPDEMIENCPVKSGYFTKVYGIWQIKDSGHRFSGQSTKSISSALRIKNNTPNEILFVDLLEKMLAICPSSRITASDALKHPFISESSGGRNGRIELPSSLS